MKGEEKIDNLQKDLGKYKLEQEKEKTHFFRAGLVFVGGALISVIIWVLEKLIP